MVTDKLYCVDLLAEFRECCLACNTLYSRNTTVKVGTHILHNLITCKCSISYFHIFVKKPKSLIKWKQVFHDYFLALVYLWFKCVAKIFYWSENALFKHIRVIGKLFCKENVRFASVANFESKIPISNLLTKLHNFPLIGIGSSTMCKVYKFNDRLQTFEKDYYELKRNPWST